MINLTMYLNERDCGNLDFGKLEEFLSSHIGITLESSADKPIINVYQIEPPGITLVYVAGDNAIISIIGDKDRVREVEKTVKDALVIREIDAGMLARFNQDNYLGCRIFNSSDFHTGFPYKLCDLVLKPQEDDS